MKRIVLLTVLALGSASAMPATAQNSETTYGSCSPNMSRNSGSVTINCTGLDPAVAAEISEVVKQLSLLNKKTATEKNQQQMAKTLRDIKNLVQAAMNQPTFQTNGPIVQNSAGNCSPNIVGNNNTNVCGPQDLKIDAEQAAELTRRLSSLPATIPKGKITLEVEIQNHKTQVAGEALAIALKNAGFNVEFGEAYMLSAMGDNYGGITFVSVSQPAFPMVGAIAALLNDLGVVSGPIPTFTVPPTAAATADFTILVKNPQE